MPTRAGACALVGALVGAIAGFLFAGAQGQHLGVPVSTAEVIEIGLMLGLFGWAAVLVILGLWLHYSLARLAWPALVIGLITAVLTILVANRLQRPYLDSLLGIVLGLLVGALLCAACGRLSQERSVIYGKRE